ncbi:MAG TPA: agmatinase family protein [Planctomycetota bacterium]|nr:agmatinase family protein [Planctomycetota bacterium]
MKRSPLLPADPNFGEGAYGLDVPKDDCLVHLVPVPFEATVSYRAGTAGGPASILSASQQVDLFDNDFGRPYRHGIYWHPTDPSIVRFNEEARVAALPIIECLGEVGDDAGLLSELAKVNERGEWVNSWLESTVEDLLAEGKIVGIVGGDHSVPFGTIKAHAARYPGMGILHLDAHADLRCAYEGFTWSHASIMHNVFQRIPEVSRIVQVGIRDFCEEETTLIAGARGRIVTHFDREMRDRLARGDSFLGYAEEIVAALPRDVYLSFDIDGLDPALCPNTGTPVPGGLDFHQICGLLKALVQSGRRIVGFDLVEVAPGKDGSEWDGNVGARLLYKMIGATVQSRLIALSPTTLG